MGRAGAENILAAKGLPAKNLLLEIPQLLCWRDRGAVTGGTGAWGWPSLPLDLGAGSTGTFTL